VLDYRTWFSFDVEFQPAGEGWKRLTRKAHGAGSGGQKAVLLHLPLFAAAAAFYASAVPTAPRLIVLDEAFAGIDRETRGRLMGLLAEFGLDFVMTSYEEWGFYEELDGLSTYHLSRERGMRGVHTDWFLWDGRKAIAMEAATPSM
jgi:Putative exonuclease SbcCD, C subunit